MTIANKSARKRNLQAKVINHTPLIHPVRSASELVNRSIPKDFIEIDMSEWRPRWLKQILKDIANDKYGGLVVPQINLAAFYTNSLLKSAGAYHELNGHMKTLLKYTGPLMDCLMYHSCLVSLVDDLTEPNLMVMAQILPPALDQALTQELVANKAEIDILQPYTNHRYFGKRAKQRIKYLENLGKEEDWPCDMCAGQLCAHRGAMYASDYLKRKTLLSTRDIVNLTYGIASFTKYQEIQDTNDGKSTTDQSREYSTTLAPDGVLSALLRLADKSEDWRKEEISTLLLERLEKTRTGIVQSGGVQDIFGRRAIPSKTSLIDSHSSFFTQVTMDLKEYSRTDDSGLATEIYTNPINRLIVNSFVVTTREDVSLFIDKKTIPEDEKLRMLSIDALINLKAFAIQTYVYLNQLVEKDYRICQSRSGSQCLFRGGFRRPLTKVNQNKIGQVYEHLLNDRRIVQIIETLKKSLVKLSKANAVARTKFIPNRKYERL